MTLNCDIKDSYVCVCGVRDIVSQVTLNCDIRDSYVGVEYVILSIGTAVPCLKS